MIRSQIYLTATEREQLRLLSHETGKSQSELIRNAIDHFIRYKQRRKHDKLSIIQAARGLWADRNDLPSLGALRKEFDRIGTERS